MAKGWVLSQWTDCPPQLCLWQLSALVASLKKPDTRSFSCLTLSCHNSAIVQTCLPLLLLNNQWKQQGMEGKTIHSVPPKWKASYPRESSDRRSHREAANQVGPSFGTLHVSIRVTCLLNCGWKYSQSQNSCRMEVLDMIFIMSNLVYEALKANAVYDKSSGYWQDYLWQKASQTLASTRQLSC